jgi:hypothetical protein
MREQTIKRMLAEGFKPVSLKPRNVKIGDAIASRNVMFGTLKTISKKTGKYGVRFDADYCDEPLTYFTPEQFEEFFLVDTRKKD